MTTTDPVAAVFNTIWSIIAIIIGARMLFDRKHFLKSNKKIYIYISKKTSLSFFAEQAKTFDSDFMGLLAIFLGIIFIIAGISFLTGIDINIPTLPTGEGIF